MRPVFIYGGLHYPAVLGAVLGRAINTGEGRIATLPAYCLYQGSNPSVIEVDAKDDGKLDGQVMDLSASESDRLSFYQAVHRLKLVSVETSLGVADCYLPVDKGGREGEPLDIHKWRLEWGDLAAEEANEVMKYKCLRSAIEVRELLQGIKLRASVQVRSRQTKNLPRQFNGRVDVISEAMSYAKFFALKDYRIDVEQFQGGMANTRERAVFMGMDASIVLPYDPVNDRVLLIEQMRLGPLARGDRNVWQFEPIAGHIDLGETPQEAARREAIEEAGLTLSRLEPIAECYPSPGASSEFYYIYAAIVDLPEDIVGVAGVEDEGENIRSRIFSFEDFMGMVERFEITVAPLVAAAYWLAAHRDRLRRDV